MTALNDAHRDDEALPDESELTEWIALLIEERGAKYLDDESTASTLTHQDISRIAADSAAAVLLDWDPTYRAQRAAMGAVGGRASHRGATFLPDALRGIEHLSVRAQAAEIGCSTGTVSSLRKQYTLLYGSRVFASDR